MSSATYYRHIKQRVTVRRSLLIDGIAVDPFIRLHWVDNFAKYYSASSLYVGREIFRSCLWTTHGLKEIESDISLLWLIVLNPSLLFLTLLNCWRERPTMLFEDFPRVQCCPSRMRWLF